MLFATRRSFNAQKNILTNNPANVTRFLNINIASAAAGRWKDGFYSQSAWLNLTMKEAVTNDVLIYVHGFNTSQAGNMARLEQIEAGLRAQGYRGAVIGFDWPSSGNPIDYDGDLLRAKKTARALVSDVILPLLARPERPKVHLLAHSMGGYSILKGLQDFGDSHGPNGWALDQIAFVSADVHQPSMERGAWGALIAKHRSKRLTNYYNGGDRVLELSKLIHGTRKRVGRSGLPTPAFSSHKDVSCTSQYDREFPGSKDTFVMSHRWWFQSEGFYKDLALTLKGEDGLARGTRKQGPGNDETLDV